MKKQAQQKSLGLRPKTDTDQPLSSATSGQVSLRNVASLLLDVQDTPRGNSQLPTNRKLENKSNGSFTTSSSPVSPSLLAASTTSGTYKNQKQSTSSLEVKKHQPSNAESPSSASISTAPIAATFLSSTESKTKLASEFNGQHTPSPILKAANQRSNSVAKLSAKAAPLPTVVV